jgi:hypothetical protein
MQSIGQHRMRASLTVRPEHITHNHDSRIIKLAPTLKTKNWSGFFLGKLSEGCKKTNMI